MYNKMFELHPDDIELIEGALNKRLAELCAENGVSEDIKSITDLLGRLHYQKVWYRPKSDQYVGG